MNEEQIRKFFDRISAFETGMEYFVLDDQGEPVSATMMAWAEWFSTDRKQVYFDEGDDWWVSSIFLGFDHSPLREGRPKLLWECLVANGEDRAVFRFASRTDLRTFHRDQAGRLREPGDEHR